jgi:hypothetical protein
MELAQSTWQTSLCMLDLDTQRILIRARVPNYNYVYANNVRFSQICLVSAIESIAKNVCISLPSEHAFLLLAA